MRFKFGWLERIIPKFAIIPMIIWFLQNAMVYYSARLINLYRPHYDLTLEIDRQLPLVPVFIVIYILSYVSWYLGYVLITRQGVKQCGVLFGMMIAKMLCLAIFLIFPTQMERPEVNDPTVFGWLVRFIYWTDQPNNLFPSIHCMENWMVWRGMCGLPGIPKWVKASFFVFMLLVFLSTLLVKQHVLVDIPSAIIVTEIGLQASRKLRLGERYAAYLQSREAHA